jgi:hypothetical protein
MNKREFILNVFQHHTLIFYSFQNDNKSSILKLRYKLYTIYLFNKLLT